jgi:hypothetical protein
VQAAEQTRKLIEIRIREPVAVAATGGCRLDQAGTAQLAQVIRDERLAHPRHLLELAHRAASAGKPEHDQQPLLVRKRAQRRSPGRRKRLAILNLREIQRRSPFEFTSITACGINFI